MENAIRVVTYAVCFGLSIYGLSCINIEKLIKGNKVKETYVLYFMIAFALAYLVAEFILNFKL